MRFFYGILAVVALAGVGILVWTVAGQGGSAATEPIVFEGMDDPQTIFQLAQGEAIGDPDAPVTIREFSDYMCPYCSQFTAQVKPLIEQELVQEGKARFIFYDFPLGGSHRHSFLAARAARCAGEQGRFWPYHDTLMGQQSVWSGMANPLSTFIDYGAALGMDRRSFESCVRSDRYADVVTANRLLGEQLGVNATPTVFVNTRRLRNPMDFPTMRQIVEEESGP